jgi:putative tryptophan/tyrosine transport system substrate-binding protein
VRRRDFITLFGGAAAWPLAARAQQSGMPVVGFLHLGSLETRRDLLLAFHRGLNETGYLERHNVAIEYRWAEGHINRLPALASDLVKQQVAAIVAAGSYAPALAAKAATDTIPIVFTAGGGDPVAAGLVVSLNRPGGNVTGVSQLATELVGKRLELLHEMVPNVPVIAVLGNANNRSTEIQLRELKEIAPSLGLQLHILNASSASDIDAAFVNIAQMQAAGLLVLADAFFTSRRVQFSTLAARYAVPAIYAWREFAEVGGLMSYGTSIADVYRQVGIYTGRILKGEKPADLPVQQPIKYALVINLRTAKAFGLDVPPTLLARADEVIE